jgi:hypothetical protein
MERALSRRQVGKAALAGAATVLVGHALAPVAAAAGRLVWYFAEGYTANGFDEYLTIQNPNPQTAALTITYYFDSGAPITRTLSVAGNQRATVNVHDAGQVGRNRTVSAKVESTNGIGVLVERPMYFTYTGAGPGTVNGGHTAIGATTAQDTWYFAEGYTGGGFDAYLAILNPTGSWALVEILYYLAPSGTVAKSVWLAPNARSTINLHDTALGVGRNVTFGFRVRSTNGAPIVAERTQYFTYSGGINGGHAVPGAAAPATRWYFGEGSTAAGYHQYFSILNPNGFGITVTLRYFLIGGGVHLRSVGVPAMARATVAVHNPYPSDPGGIGAGWDLSAILTSSAPFVAERVLYFPFNASINGGNVSFGATAPFTRWYFPEGYTGSGFTEYLVLFNPNLTAASVALTYSRRIAGSGVYEAQANTVTVAGQGRSLILVNSAVGSNREVAVTARCTNGVGVIAERPMYFVYGGSVNGGHLSIGYAPLGFRA